MGGKANILLSFVFYIEMYEPFRLLLMQLSFVRCTSLMVFLFILKVRIVFEDYDRTALIGSVYYQDGELIKDLAVQLLENVWHPRYCYNSAIHNIYSMCLTTLISLFYQGLAKYVEWSASFLQDKVRLQLKNSELAAKNNRLRMWNNYMPPPTTSQAIKDQNFTGKVCSSQ